MVPIDGSTWQQYACLDWGPALFHPADSHLKEAVLASGNICEHVGDDGEYSILRFGDMQVRLRSRLLALFPCPEPAFKIGDTVRTKPPRTVRVGQVRRIVWHAKNAEPFFILTGSGKSGRNRYFSSELERLES